jgi:hypothetical protein
MHAINLRLIGLILGVMLVSVLAGIIQANAQPVAPAPFAGALDIDKILDLALKSIVLVAGGRWFLYRAYSGYLTVNLALELQIDRSRLTDLENIAIQITLKKGDQGKLNLYDIKARLRTADDGVAVFPRWVTFGNDVSATEQYNVKAISGIRRLTLCNRDEELSYKKYSEKTRYLRLAPGDEMTFSCLFQVPLNTICIVDAAVLGRKAAGHRTGQWRASIVSVPPTPGPVPAAP